MNRTAFRFKTLACALIVIPLVGLPATAREPGRTQVNGTLSDIDGIPILRVWGTAQERGFAHGFLMADRASQLMDGFLRDGPLARSAGQYETQTLPKLRRMKVDPEHEAEMRGILAGIEQRLGALPQIPFLGRPLRYEDVLAVNCTGDLIRSGCSSFAAWGALTEDGQTIGGRNMDWPAIPALLDTQFVLVNVPPPEGGKLGWASVTWPTFVGCLTGMNAEGVTVATHDAGGHPPSTSAGFTPYGWIFRNALESARADTALEDVARAIRAHVCIVGNNMMVTRPSTDGAPGGYVFEFDGDLPVGGGLTVREHEPADSFLACTNHFRKRSPPIGGERYAGLTRTLGRIAASDGKRHVDLGRAWKMMRGVSLEGTLTYHSVVFEPDKRLMHIAFNEGRTSAPWCKKVTFDVAKLLAGDYPGGK
jgi:hypothetical protein